MTKHHLVQIDPVAIKATFWVKESFSAGRRKSDAPAMTTPHFMTGALYRKKQCQRLAIRVRRGALIGAEAYKIQGDFSHLSCLPEMDRLDSDLACP